MNIILAASLAACGGSGDATPTITVLSSHPSMVTGGDAFVSVAVPDGISAQDIKLSLNGADVTGKLQYDSATKTMLGVVNGMAIGSNTLSASEAGLTATLAVTNYSINGPVFSGRSRCLLSANRLRTV